MIQLNLLPDLKKEFIKSQKNKGVVISVSILVTLGAIGLSILLFVYVTFVQQFQIGLMTDDIKNKAKQLEEIPDINKYLSIQNQLASITPLHDEKGIYSRLFEYLNVLNPSPPNNINLTGAQLVTTDSSVILNGTTASFESLNVFVDTLKNAQVNFKVNGEGELIKEAMFDQVFVQNSGLGKTNNTTLVSFTIRALYKSSVFNARNTDVVAEVPNITTTPSATQSPVPQQLFNSEGAE